MKNPFHPNGGSVGLAGANLSIYAAARPRVGRQSEAVERWVFWLYLGGLAWAPLWYGGNELVAWGVNAMLFPGMAAVYEISLLLRRKHHPIGIRNLAAPVLLFAAVVVWIVLQTVTGIPLRLINPIWQMAGDALGRPLAGSISVDRDLTNLGLIRLITAASAFWLGLQICRDQARAVTLVTSIAAIGSGYAVLGLVFLKTGHPAWLDIPTSGGRVTATFVNHNSFATFMGLSLVAIIGLLISLYRREVINGGSWRLRLALFIETTGQRGAALLAGGFVILVALLLTGSRGGVISSGLALVVLAILAQRRGGGRARGRNPRPIGFIWFGALLITAVVYAFGGVVFSSLDEHGVSDASRISIYLLTLRSIFDAPLLGWGYGTFADVFPLYRDQSIGVFGAWGQAHDTYLEIYQGLGLVFGTLLIATVVLFALRCAKGAIRRQENAVVPAVAASAAILVGVHSLVDFSLQIQAVTLIFMAMLAAGVAQSESSRVALQD